MLNVVDNLNCVQVINKPCMGGARNMHLIPWTLRSGSEHFCFTLWKLKRLKLFCSFPPDPSILQLFLTILPFNLLDLFFSAFSLSIHSTFPFLLCTYSICSSRFTLLNSFNLCLHITVLCLQITYYILLLSICIFVCHFHITLPSSPSCSTLFF